MHYLEHVASSLRVFGQSFSFVHKFLDHYFKEYSIAHRMLLHHKKGVDLVVAKFGEDARQPAEQHIIEDVGIVPDDWKWYKEPIFLNFGDYPKIIRELKKLYPYDLLQKNDQHENEILAWIESIADTHGWTE